MADIDVGPLLRALAQDASRRAHLADAATLRRSGEQRRLGKAVGVAAAVTLLTTSTFGLMARGGFGSDLPASGLGAISGSVSALPTSATASTRPTDVVVPPAPTWQVPYSVDPMPGPQGGPTLGPAPSQNGVVPTPPPATGASTTTTLTTTVTVPPRGGPTGGSSTIPSTSPAPSLPGIPAPPTPPTSTPPTPTSATPPPPTGGMTTLPALAGAYELWLSDQAGGRIGFRPAGGGGFGDPSGTLPYPPRLATSAVVTTVRAGATPVTAAVGLDQGGQAHLTFFADGKVSYDHLLAVDWAGVSALVALHNQSEGRMVVVAFRTDGTVLRHVLDVADPALTPRTREVMVMAQRLLGVTAATHARHDPDAMGIYRSIWTYVVVGDRLLLVRVGTDGTTTTSESVASGMAGTTTLARLATGTPGAGGVAAWDGSGAGFLYYAKDAFGPLVRVGIAGPLPR